MKKNTNNIYLIIIFIILFVNISSAQDDSSWVVIFKHDLSTWWEGKSCVYKSKQDKGKQVDAAMDFLKNNLSKFFLPQDTLKNLKVGNVWFDSVGYLHVLFEQTYKNIAAPGGILVNFDRDGCIIEVHDDYIRDLNLDITPRISAQQAIEIAKKDFMEKGIGVPSIAGEKLPVTIPEFVPQVRGSPTLEIHGWISNFKFVYKINLESKGPESGKYYFESATYRIDAHTGEIIEKSSGKIA